jgi:hypothetical protein
MTPNAMPVPALSCNFLFMRLSPFLQIVIDSLSIVSRSTFEIRRGIYIVLFH